MSQERRQFSRLPFRGTAFLSHNDRTIKGIIEDISMNGIFLKSLAKVEVNNTVKLSILDTPISNVSAKVVRVTEKGVGLQLEKTIFDR